MLCALLCGPACTPASVDTLNRSDHDAAAQDTANSGADVESVRDAPLQGDVFASPDGMTQPVDASVPGDVATMGTDPMWVDVEVRTSGECPTPTACGGSVVGTWDVAGVCVAVPVETALMQCPVARVTRRGGRARGTVTFGEHTATRHAEWSAEVEMFIPVVCARFVGGCAGIQTSLRLLAPESLCMANTNGDCDCTARQSGVINDADGYSTSNGEIVSATLRHRWEYCITGDTLRYHDVSTQMAREPGVITLQRH